MPKGSARTPLRPKLSASVDVVPCYLYTRLTLCLAPHQHQRKFFSEYVWVAHKFFLQMEEDFNLYKMEHDLNIVANGSRPQYCRQWKTTSISSKWKTTSIIWKMEHDLNYLENGRQPQVLVNWRWPNYFCKWKTSSIFWQRKDHINFLLNGMWPHICKPSIYFWLQLA